MNRSCLVGLLGPALTSFGCMRDVPPPPPPISSTPVDTTALPEVLPSDVASHGTVTFVTDVPARVERALGGMSGGVDLRWTRRPVRREGGRAWELLCERTPCKVRVGYGNHLFRFSGLENDGRVSIAYLTTNEPNVAVNHTLGREHGSTGLVVGAAMIVAGIAAIAVPYGLDMSNHEPTPAVLMAAGVGSIFGGVAVMAFFPGARQEGSTTHWIPEPRTQAKGVSLRYEF